MKKLLSHGLLRSVEKKNKVYYYCNRSGNFKSRGAGKRHLKTQGTSKISGICTASIVAQIKSDNCVEVMVYNTHYGHEISGTFKNT